MFEAAAAATGVTDINPLSFRCHNQYEYEYYDPISEVICTLDTLVNAVATYVPADVISFTFTRVSAFPCVA